MNRLVIWLLARLNEYVFEPLADDWECMKRGTYAGLPIVPLIAALAPVVAKGVGSIIKKKQEKKAQKAADLQAQQEATAEKEAAQRQWEAQQNSPEAQMRRMQYNMKLGRMAGALGGLDKVPPSLRKAYDAARSAQAYTPGADYVAPVRPKTSGWDIAGGAMDALSYLDTNKLKTAVGGGSGAGSQSWLGQNTSSNLVPTTSPTGGGLSPLITKLKKLPAGGLATPQYPPPEDQGD